MVDSTGGGVAGYRIYFVDARGRLRMGEGFVCDTEAEAHARLERAPRDDAEQAELWCGGRLVRRLGRGSAAR